MKTQSPRADFLLLFFLLGCLFVMFYPVFFRLWTVGWDAADYDHAVFVIPVAAALIFQKRQSLSPLNGWSFSGALVFAFGFLVYLFAAFNHFMFLEAFSFCLVVWGIFLLRYSPESLSAVLFPLAYLLFLVPPPSLAIDLVTFPLKQISMYGSYGLLKILQVPVSLEGVILKVRDYQLFIADSCSGFRSMVTLLALGAVYAYLQKTMPAKKWILFLSVIPLGIIANIIRIALTGLVANWGGKRYAEGFFHDFSGIVLFLVAIGGLVVVTDFVCRRRFHVR